MLPPPPTVSRAKPRPNRRNWDKMPPGFVIRWHPGSTTSGDDQHYLSAALIGGFGIVCAGKPLRKAQIVVRELASGEVHLATAEDVAFRRALYRLLAPGPDVDPDIVDKLWTPSRRIFRRWWPDSTPGRSNQTIPKSGSGTRRP